MDSLDTTPGNRIRKCPDSDQYSRVILSVIFKFAILLLLCLASCSHKANTASNNESNAADTVYIESYGIDPLNWGINVSVFNSEEIDAMTIPLTFSANQNRLVADSTIFDGGRVESFRVKIVRPDTITQCVTIALFADIGNSVPPMPPGNGIIARVFVSSLDHNEIAGFRVDTTTTPPGNSLLLITPNSEGIVPAVVLRTF